MMTVSAWTNVAIPQHPWGTERAAQGLELTIPFRGDLLRPRATFRTEQVRLLSTGEWLRLCSFMGLSGLGG